MKKVNQLFIIEGDDNLPPLLEQFQPLLQSFAISPITAKPISDFTKEQNTVLPQLVILHSNLTTTNHLQQFVTLHAELPSSTFIIVGQKQEEELCLLALEAGAEDCIKTEQLTMAFMQKTIILSLRRSRTERQLSQSLEQISACIQNTPNVAVQWYNGKGEVLFWNHASERIFEWTAAEAVGKKLDQLIHTPLCEELWINKLKHVAITHEPSEPQEWMFRYRDGTEGWCISTLFPIPSFDGECWFVCMDIDITDRKKMEVALEQSEERYRSLVEQQADAITIFDEDGKIIEVNSSAMQLLNYTLEEFKRMTLSEVFYREEMEANPIEFDVLAEGKSTIKQRKMQRKNGGLVETEVHTKKLSDGYFLSTVRDLTERIDVQRRLEKEIALSDSIINSLPGIFFLFTEEGRYLRWNRQLEIATRYAAGQIKKMTPLDFFDTNEKASVQQAIDSAFANGQATIETELLTRHGAKIYYYFTGIAIQYEGLPCILGMGFDFTPLRSLEKELAEQKISAQKKVMQAMIEAEEKEKAKLGLELHDNVNQILSVVRMYLSLLQSGEPPEGVTVAQTMVLLNKAIEEIRQLSHSLAVSYQFGAGLADALNDMVNNIAVTGNFSIQLITAPLVDERITNDQKLALYRIIQEQLNNIIKHAKATKVEVRISLHQKEMAVKIVDNGKGFLLKETTKGLGLNNITNRAEALGGKVIIDTAPGRGCRLSVHMPLQA